MADVKTKYKSKLIDKIKSINDKNILDEVNRLLEIDVDISVYETSNEQKDEVKLAVQQLTGNKGINSKQADKEIDEWFSR